MINHFKAEFYKLRHSKILITILGVCAAVIMVSFALGDMTFFGAGDGTESVIGFQAKCYLSSEIPTFQTVARSSLAAAVPVSAVLPGSFLYSVWKIPPCAFL